MPAKAAPKAAAKAAPPAKAAAKTAGKVVAKAAGKKVAPKGKKKADSLVAKTDPRCVRPKKIFSIGGDLPPRRKVDLTHFVRWPRYVWRQRRIRILQNRLKIPAPVHQFSKTADATERKAIFTFAAKYQPESKKERKARHLAIAASKTSKGKDAAVPPKKLSLRCGIKCVTRLIEQKRAKLVLIAHDVTPLELVLCLPALCRAQDIPYVIVRGKALLGKLCGFKQAAVVAFDKINPEDGGKFASLVESIKTGYLTRTEETRLRSGGLKLGRKSQDKLAARQARARKIAAQSKAL
jgi:large subunit ribosomal protein L7Ae